VTIKQEHKGLGIREEWVINKQHPLSPQLSTQAQQALHPQHGGNIEQSNQELPNTPLISVGRGKR
jgi:hypothetical protein